MRTLLLKRAALLVLVLLVVTSASFVTLNALGDPLANIVGPLARIDCDAVASGLLTDSPGPSSPGPSDSLRSDCETVAEARAEYRLDKPIAVRYLLWLGDIARGDLGWSFQNDQPVAAIIGEKLPETLMLLLIAQTVSLAVAIPWGLAAAYRADRPLDQASTVVSFGLLAVPNFALGVVLLYLLALRWQVFPSAYESHSLPGMAFSLLLPGLTLGLPMAAAYQRLLRTDLITTLQEDYILMARAKGLPPARVMLRHALRPSMFSVVTVFGLNTGTMIGGSFAVEQIFSIPGIGREMISAVIRDDFPVVLGIVVVVATGFVLVNFLVELFYAWLDPRVRAA